VGKLTQNALYVHANALSGLPPVLRIYEGCATQLAGSIQDVTIIKLHRYKSAISYLTYPHFDRDPHPALTRSVIVDLQHMTITQRNYQNSKNPSVLHRKELLVDSNYRLYKCFKKLTLQEERLDLLNSKLPIGTRSDWQGLLKKRGVKLVGHRVVPIPAQKQPRKKQGSVA